jgi:hypothetical protein
MGQAKPERQPMRDEALVTAEPGFYEPGRSPSLLVANWFWLRHIILALRRGGVEPLRAFTEVDAVTGSAGPRRRAAGGKGGNSARRSAARAAGEPRKSTR